METDSIFHYFSLILQQEGKDDQVPDKSTEIVKYIQYQMVTCWKKQETKFQTKYFIIKENISALRKHMRKMEEFADNETLSNPIVELYQTMLLSCKDTNILMQIMRDNENVNVNDMMHFNWFFF